MDHLRILHITPWYPTEEQPQKAIWIKRHIDCLRPFCANEIWVLSIGRGKFERSRTTKNGVRWMVMRHPWAFWRSIELFSFLILFIQLVFLGKARSMDVINFHIAYPNLVYFHWLRPFLKCQIVITEHWSAYHFNFNSTKPMRRVKRMFCRGLPVITVSESLAADIENYCGTPLTRHHVPNVVDVSIFLNRGIPRGKVLLLGAWWKEPKRPFIALEALSTFLANNADWSVRIFGGGPQSSAIELWCKEHGQSWLGLLGADAIASELAKSFGFLMPSDYETFSVAVAEALCCGCPVLCSDVGGMSELIDSSNGIKVADSSRWGAALNQFTSTLWARDTISDEAQKRYSKEAIGRLYYDTLKQIMAC
jgi:L-malate glycosyltransferase